MLSTIISSFGISDIFSLLIVFIIIYISQYYYRYFTRPNPQPGPFPLPIVGNVHQQKGQFDDWLLLLHEKYGDIFEINLAGIRLIVLCRTDLIENMNVPSVNRTKYPNRPAVGEGMEEYGMLGLGVGSNNDYKSWKYNRQFFSQAMMTPSFNYQAIEWTNELWNEMESYWNELGENHEINLIKWMHRFTNEIIFRIATGVKNNCVASHYKMILLENNKNSLDEKEIEKIKESEKFIDSIEVFMDGFMFFLTYNNFMRHYVPFIRGKANSILKNRDYFYNKILNIVKERRIEIENTPLDKPLRHDMLTSHITANTPRDINITKHGDTDMLRPMTDREIFGNVVDAMTGGTDTTANLFCFIVYHLAHHPEVVQRLRQELDEVLGNDLTKPITYSDLEKLYYCEAVIKEVTRHRPVVFMLGRLLCADKDEVGGYTWPKGTAFTMLYYAMMKRKDYWTDPEKFDPDRFYKIDESDKYLLEKQHVKESFTIFGGGIRVCPGRKLAMIELRFLLASIYRKYDVELANMNAPLSTHTHFLSVCKELVIKVKPRKF